MSHGFRHRRWMGWWVAAWLAVVATQAILSVHSELVAHADDEHCELCDAAASSSAALAASLPPALMPAGAPVMRPTAPAAILLPSLHHPRQPRAPPPVLS